MSGELTRRGLIRGIIASVASTALIVRATPAETALVKEGAPVEVLAHDPPDGAILEDPFAPMLYVKTKDGDFVEFAWTRSLNVSIPRYDVTAFGDSRRTYVNGLIEMTGDFIVTGPACERFMRDRRGSMRDHIRQHYR